VSCGARELIGARGAKHGEEPLVVCCILRSTFFASCGRKCGSMACRYPCVRCQFVWLRLLRLCTKYILGC